MLPKLLVLLWLMLLLLMLVLLAVLLRLSARTTLLTPTPAGDAAQQKGRISCLDRIIEPEFRTSQMLGKIPRCVVRKLVIFERGQNPVQC